MRKVSRGSLGKAGRAYESFPEETREVLKNQIK
jgi:hypothetical protein